MTATNTLYIEALKMTPIRCHADEIDYGITVSSDYCSHSEVGFESFKDLFNKYPTRLALLKKLLSMPLFADIGFVDRGVVILKGQTELKFKGFPQDDSLKVIEAF